MGSNSGGGKFSNGTLSNIIYLLKKKKNIASFSLNVGMLLKVDHTDVNVDLTRSTPRQWYPDTVTASGVYGGAL